MTIERGWQPIETAPKDGTRIIAYGQSRAREQVALMRWHRPANRAHKGFWYRLGSGGSSAPTHWMPLPDPPAEGP